MSMGDAADKAEGDRERALELWEKDREERQRRIAAAMQPYNPKLPRFCCDCHARLSRARLKAQPCAARCVRCAEIIEREGFV